VRLIRDSGILTDAQIDETLRWAREATFIEVEPAGAHDRSAGHAGAPPRASS
jgi:hypothetical protein